MGDRWARRPGQLSICNFPFALQVAKQLLALPIYKLWNASSMIICVGKHDQLVVYVWVWVDVRLFVFVCVCVCDRSAVRAIATARRAASVAATAWSSTIRGWASAVHGCPSTVHANGWCRNC